MWRVTRVTTVAALLAASLVPAALAPTGAWARIDPAAGLTTQVWHESEGNWDGVWTPAGDGAYRAEWVFGVQRQSADLRIETSGDQVRVTRSQPLGTCAYDGRLQPDGRTVVGVYRCSWNLRSMKWKATIGGP
jgi:hypothetical protein